MMLDMKRTFDEVVESQASPEKARQILENPFYVALSSSFAGTQEYMAMEKLGQLHADAQRDGTYDLIVVDTPPSRSALDFLDAPERLSSFLDGRFIRLLLAPAKGPARLMSAGFGMVTNALTKVLGAQVLRDMQTFVAAFDTLFGGFRQRAQKTFELLQADGTAFLVVAAPEPDALREAAYFVERLSEDDMPLAGLVVNRASPEPQGDVTRGGGLGRGAAAAQAPRELADRGSAATPCGPRPHGRAGGAAAEPLRGGAPTGADGGGAGPSGRRARPGRAAPGRLAHGGGAADLTRLPDGVAVLLGAAGDRCLRQRGSGADDHTDLLLASLLENGSPRCVRTPAKQSSALAFGHPAPDAPLDLVVESLSEALGAHRTRTADLLCLVLLRTADEQLVGLLTSARSRGSPILIPHNDVPTIVR